MQHCYRMQDVISLNQRLLKFYDCLVSTDGKFSELHGLEVEFNGVLGSGNSSLHYCTIIQFLSKVFKVTRENAHPERYIGTVSTPVTSQLHVSMLKTVENFALMAIEACFKSLHLCPCDYLLHFVVQLMGDVVKYNLSEKNDTAIVLKVSNVISGLSFEISCIELTVQFKILDILGSILQRLIEVSDSPTEDTTKQFLNTLRIIVKILDSLFQRRQRADSIVSVGGEACSLIDPPAIDSPVSVSAWWLSCTSTLNTALKYLMTNDVTTSLADTRQTVLSLMTLVAIAMELTSPCELLLALSENDKDLLLLLLQLVEIRLRLDSMMVNEGNCDGGSDVVIGKKRVRGEAAGTKRDIEKDDLLSATGRLTSVRGYDPVSLFYLLVGRCLCCDELLLFDLLTGPETKALEYLLRVSKIMSSSSGEVLRERHCGLSELHMAGRRVSNNSIVPSAGSASGTSSRRRAVLWVLDEQKITSYEEAGTSGTVRDSRVSGENERLLWDIRNSDNLDGSSSNSNNNSSTLKTNNDYDSAASVPPSLSEIRGTLIRLTDTLERANKTSLPFSPSLLIKRLRIIVNLL